MMAASLQVLFQWPLTFFSNAIASSLPDYWHFALTLHCSVASLIAWGIATRKLDIATAQVVNARQQSNESSRLVGLFLIAMVWGVSVAVYLTRIPLNCTALYSFIVDPHLVLLARELSVKLLGSSLATMAYGAVVNSVAPALVAVCAIVLVQAERGTRWRYATVVLPLAILAIASVLFSGAKGALVPTAVVMTIAAVLWATGPVGRVVAFGSVAVMLGCAILVFELARERPVSRPGTHYDFPRCVVLTNSCRSANALLDSMADRDESLGMSADHNRKLAIRLQRACINQTSRDVQTPGDIDSFDTGRLYGGRAAVRTPLSTDALPERIKVYGVALVYRAFVLPVQLATWHSLYVDLLGAPGWAAFPFAKRIIGTSVNMPELVYGAYGVIYSGGDATKGSTSPTSFVVAYPLYWGWWGLLFAIGLVTGWDLVMSLLLRRLSTWLLPLAAGLTAVCCVNFMTSEFLTTMLSHGGAVTMLLVALLGVRWGAGHGKRAFDVVVAAVLLLLLSLPMVVVAILVRLRLGRPVLFAQVRPGKYAKPFTLYKFRSMRDAMDQHGRQLPDAARLSSFGVFLRASSIDELPELWNVLRGDMSLVGPRPLLMEYLPIYSAQQARRHDVRPGITGWAQVNGRNALSWREKFELDNWYLENQGFWLDLRILRITLGKVLRRDGVNADGAVTMPKFTGKEP